MVSGEALKPIDHLMSRTNTTILGKRKTRATSATLLLQLSASDSNHDQSDVSWQEPNSDVELPQTPLRSRKTSEFVLVNGSLVKNTNKKYHCTFIGCEKLYSKPCRLEEHERSHTGKVGFSFKFSLSAERAFV
jgi:general transcription factor IIIA